jgi:hypothetical protein
MKAGLIDNFKHLSQFYDLKDFNSSIEQWLAEYKSSFTKSELIAFKRLVRFSAKIPGVSNAKIGTILKATHDKSNGNGISRSTFKRMLIKAKKLGILIVYETERKNGSQSNNIFVFNRFELPKVETIEPPSETNNLFETSNTSNNKRTDDLDHTFTSDSVPGQFTSLVKYFFNDSKSIELFYSRCRIAAYKANYDEDKGKVLDVAINSFKQTVSKLKKGVVRDKFGYFYKICERKFEDLYFSELTEMNLNQTLLSCDHWLML